MAIAQVGTQAGGVTTDAAASTSRAFGANVTAGNLVYLVAGKYQASGTIPSFAAGNVTKSAGTATIGTVQLDSSVIQNVGTNYGVAVWSAIVTGTGSLTLQVAGGDTNTYWAIATDELSASGGWDASRVEDFKTGTGNATTQTTANMTTVNGGAFIGGTTLDTGINETTYTKDGSFNQLYREPDGNSHAVALHEIRIAGSGLTDAVSTTLTAGKPYLAAGAIYKEVAAGGSSTLTVENATATLTGQDVIQALTLGVTEAALTFTGSDVGSVSSVGVLVDFGTLTISGQDVTLVANAAITIPVTNAALTLEGQEIPCSLEVPWTEATLTLTGQDVTLVAGVPVVLGVTEAALALSGQSVNLVLDEDYILPVTNATITFTGQDVTLTAVTSFTLIVDQGQITLAGQDVAFFTPYVTGTGGGRKCRDRAAIRLLNFGR